MFMDEEMERLERLRDVPLGNLSECAKNEVLLAIDEEEEEFYELEEELAFLENKGSNVFFNGVKIENSIKNTLKTNINRKDLKTGRYFTKTKIITSYCRYYNLTKISRITNKTVYIMMIKELKEELALNGITAGKKWLNGEIMPFKLGNKKLEPSTLILNIGCSTFCISKNKGLCSLCGGCYAFSAELQYLNSLLYRIEQIIKFNGLSVEEIAGQILKKAKHNEIRFIRYNEAGDVWDEEDIIKLINISKIVYDEAGIFSYIYSHRLDMNLSRFNTEYFKINKSEIDFIAVDEFNNSDGEFICSGSCYNCVFCKFDCLKPIKVLKHGSLSGIDKRTAGKVYSDMLTQNIYYMAFDLNNKGYTDYYGVGIF